MNALFVVSVLCLSISSQIEGTPLNANWTIETAFDWRPFSYPSGFLFNNLFIYTNLTSDVAHVSAINVDENGRQMWDWNSGLDSFSTGIYASSHDSSHLLVSTLDFGNHSPLHAKHYLSLLDLSTGKEEWKAQSKFPIFDQGAIALAKDRVFEFQNNGSYFSVVVRDRKNGSSILNEFQLSPQSKRLCMQNSYSNQAYYHETEKTLILTCKRVMIAMDGETGRELWYQEEIGSGGWGFLGPRVLLRQPIQLSKVCQVSPQNSSNILNCFDSNSFSNALINQESFAVYFETRGRQSNIYGYKFPTKKETLRMSIPNPNRDVLPQVYPETSGLWVLSPLNSTIELRDWNREKVVTRIVSNVASKAILLAVKGNRVVIGNESGFIGKTSRVMAFDFS